MWTGLPLVLDDVDARLATDVQAWDFLIQYWKAVRERYKAAVGSEHWPRTSMVWESGTITAATSTTVTDNTKAWALPAAGLDNPWASADPVEWAPGSWVLVIDSCDPKLVIKAPITTWTATELTVPTLQGQLAIHGIAAGSLVGRFYRVIRENGLWWAERQLPWPQDPATATGEVASASGEIIVAEPLAKPWVVDSYAGFDVISFDGTSYRRARVIGNSETGQIDHDQAWVAAVGATFWIVAADARFDPDLAPSYPYQWYSGATEAYRTHTATDGLGSVGKPQLNVTYQVGDISLCDDETFTLFDIDHWSDLAEVCSEADQPFNPYVPRTLRYLQAELERLCTSFVPRANYTGSPSIPLYTPATLFKAANINSAFATITAATSTRLDFTMAALPWTPIDLHWSILADDGKEVLLYGYSEYDGTGIAGDFDLEDPPGTSLYEGKTVVISLGWTRWVPREFGRMYDKTYFMPDGLVIDPPIDAAAPDGPGTWITRPTSTHYLTATADGHVIDGTEARDAIAEGHVARYVGDNAQDPTTGYKVGAANVALAAYQDHGYVGRRADFTQRLINASRSGTVTAVAVGQLTDNTKDWWNTDFYVGGVLIEHTGTADAGSTTSLTDSTKAANNFWLSDRFVDFVIEVEVSTGVWEKRPIATHAATVITWVTPLSVSANGKPYKIREPKYELNRWKGRTITFSGLGTATITHSDDTTLYFEPPSFADQIIVGTRYKITDPLTGTVWIRQGGEWLKPVGIDARGGAKWLRDQKANLASYKKRYGRYMIGDGVLEHIFRELYVVINLLTWTKVAATWDANNQDNSKTAVGDTTSGDLAADKVTATNRWNADTPPDTEVDSPPRVWATSDKIKVDTSYSTNKVNDMTRTARRFAFARATAPTFSLCPIAAGVDWYNYATINEDDDDAGLQPNDPSIEENWAFSDQGDPVGYRVWTLFEQDATSTDAARNSDQFGSLDQPSWPVDPPDPTDDADPPTRRTTGHGYYVADQVAILRWDVAGGFEFVEPAP